MNTLTPQARDALQLALRALQYSKSICGEDDIIDIAISRIRNVLTPNSNTPLSQFSADPRIELLQSAYRTITGIELYMQDGKTMYSDGGWCAVKASDMQKLAKLASEISEVLGL